MRASTFFAGLAVLHAAPTVLATTALGPRADEVSAADISAAVTTTLDKRSYFGVCIRSWFLGCYQIGLGPLPDDVNNCGSCCNVCSTSWANGYGSSCLGGTCMPGGCDNGWTLNTASGSCVNLQTDTQNCGSIGNGCGTSWSNGFGSQCQGGQCLPGGCNGGFTLNTATRTCVNTQSDTNNCGRTGNVCSTSWPNGSGAQCISGNCAPGSCSSGYTLNTASRSCVNTQSDTQNCGTTNNVCSTNWSNGSGSQCFSGQCAPGNCNPGYTLNTVSRSCVNTQSDAQNCGRTGNVCSTTWPNGSGAQCISGNCAPGSCNSGYTLNTASRSCVNTQSDTQNCGTTNNVCSTNWSNGSGAQCISGNCAPGSCNSGYTLNTASRSCVNTQSDTQNCGTTNNVCSTNWSNGSGSQCLSGQCAPGSCNPGYTLNTASRSCVNTQSDTQNCGRTGNVCSTSWPNGSGAQCISGNCAPGSCNSGYTLNTASRSCVNTQSDTQNCGTTNNVCSTNWSNGSGSQCLSGQCAPGSCNPGYTLNTASRSCVNTQSDTQNCGRTGNVCSTSWPNGSGAQCISGNCAPGSCSSGYTLNTASRSCVNTQSDTQNCGTTGNVCLTVWPNGSGAQCISGNCAPGACNSGYSLNTASRSCVNTQTDAGNCGTVGYACPNVAFPNGIGLQCYGGKCMPTNCLGGYVLNTASGTCVNTQTDVSNCGTTGNVCLTTWPNGSGAQCTSGKCGPASCNSGYALNTATGSCINTQSDAQNCGSLRNVCNIANAATQACSNGNCVATSCNGGFSLTSSGTCMNTATDVNNCGGISKACSLPNASAQQCVNGVCQATACVAGYAVSGTACINVQNDPNNCGGVGQHSGYAFDKTYQICRSITDDLANCGALSYSCAIPNASTQICRSGTCIATACAGNYKLSADGTSCVAVNTNTDTQNCGKMGNVCSTSWPNGSGAQCISGNCAPSACNSGYTLSTASRSCVNTQTDAGNCGTVGYACPNVAFPNGIGLQCYGGKCMPTNCVANYVLNTASGTCVNTQSDVSNCGTTGNVCLTTWPNGSGAQCTSGKCGPASCNSGYALNPATGSCINTQSDTQNCGSLRNVCNVANAATQACSNGNCVATSCNGGFSLTSSGTCMNTANDVNNCGGIAKVCSLPNASAQQCVNGGCQATACATGYAVSGTVCINVQNDPSNCGGVGQQYICPASYLHGGAGVCVLGLCSTTCDSGYAFDKTYQICRSITDDLANCGALSHCCAIPNASTQICQSGTCIATACAGNYKPSADGTSCDPIDFTSDPQNCGTKGNVCTFLPAGATGTCVAKVCTYTSCPTGYSIVKNACILKASGRARVKRHAEVAEKKKSLCPAGEQACPIAGSTSFANALAQHRSSGNELTGFLAESGGYECLDTMQALESCGGCVSAGEGRDCTAIKGAVNVGCDAGVCVIHSCIEGYRPALGADHCVRIRARSGPGSHAPHASRISHIAHQHRPAIIAGSKS
ncbi:hypothetical protein JCM10908_007074 [Rhodotorula pacifica]|uniref:uncharacterized protein n=1 Tax=Rhodotorula pacifica TaxID=1495444 RepID=UPI00316B6A6A